MKKQILVFMRMGGNSTYLRQRLSAKGFVVLMVQAVAAVEDALRRNPIDFVVCQEELPEGGDGLEFLKTLRQSEQPWPKKPQFVLLIPRVPGEDELVVASEMNVMLAFDETRSIEHLIHALEKDVE
jgi:DNA-binding response OmpR family regulator